MRDERYMCPRCGIIRPEEDGDGCVVEPVDGFEECRFCGGNAASWSDLQTHLAAQGLHVVTAADKAVLEACAEEHIVPGVHPRFAYSAESVAKAELARRGSAK